MFVPMSMYLQFSRLMVVALQEKIAAFDTCTFKSCFCITSEYFIKYRTLELR